MHRPSILVIEDDPDIVELIQFHLEREGFVTKACKNGESGLKSALAHPPDLVLLDLMLPGIQGIEVCRSLRRNARTQNTPVVMLTAKGEESDVVLGLELGADDYIAKPFSPRELVARLRAVLRRASKASPTAPGILTSGPLEIDLDRFEVLLEGKPLTLTRSEYRLLVRLLSQPGKVLTRDRLLDDITEGKSVIIDRNVDVHIGAIRRKLGPAGRLIATVRGVGYKWLGPQDERDSPRRSRD